MSRLRLALDVGNRTRPSSVICLAMRSAVMSWNCSSPNRNSTPFAVRLVTHRTKRRDHGGDDAGGAHHDGTACGHTRSASDWHQPITQPITEHITQ